MLWVVKRHPGGKNAAHVAVLDEELRDAQMVNHEIAPHPGHFAHRDRRPGRLRETEARNAGNDHREGVVLAASKSLGMRDHPKEFDERSRPAMREDHRTGVLAPARLQDEMDIQSVDARLVVLEPVDRRFRASPVVPVGPVRCDAWK